MKEKDPKQACGKGSDQVAGWGWASLREPESPLVYTEIHDAFPLLDLV